MGVDQVRHARGDESPNRRAFGDPTPQVRRRHLEHWDIRERESPSLRWSTTLTATTIDDDHPGQGGDDVRLMPSIETGGSVGPDDQMKGVVGVRRREIGEGVGGVRRTVSVDLYRRDLHSGNAGHGRFHHGEADRRRRDRPLLGLLPWVTSNDEPDFVERKRVADLESDGEVAHVRGIERASKDTDLSIRPV